MSAELNPRGEPTESTKMRKGIDLNPTGKTIEEHGANLAQYRRLTMYAGDSETICPIVKVTDERILKMPRLSTGGWQDKGPRFSDDLHFDPVGGEIYPSRWIKVKKFKDEETGKYSIKDAERYSNIHSFRDPELLEDLPKHISVVRLVLPRVYDGLEKAISQQRHILGECSPSAIGAEPRNMRRIIYWVNNVSREISEGGTSPERLAELSTQAAELMKNAGLITAVDETKQKLAKMLIRATKRDSLERVNPTVSRIRLRSALLSATRRLVVSEFVNRKSSANLGVLMAEREFTRDSLEQAYVELGDVQERLAAPDIAESDKEELASVIKEIATQYLRHPRMAPYLIPARMSAIFLVGSREKRKELNRQVLGEEIANDIYELPPADALVKEGEYYSASRRVQWARSIIDEVLNDPSAQIEEE